MHLLNKIFAMTMALVAVSCSSTTSKTEAALAMPLSIASLYDSIHASAAAFDLVAFRKESTWTRYQNAVKNATNDVVAYGPYSWHGSLNFLKNNRDVFARLSEQFPTHGDYLDRNKIEIHPDRVTQADVENNLKNLQTLMREADSFGLLTFKANQDCKYNQRKQAMANGCMDMGDMTQRQVEINLEGPVMACLRNKINNGTNAGATVPDCDTDVPVNDQQGIAQNNVYNCGGSARCQNNVPQNGRIMIGTGTAQ